MHAVSYTNDNLQIKNHTIPKNYVSLRRTTQYRVTRELEKWMIRHHQTRNFMQTLTYNVPS